MITEFEQTLIDIDFWTLENFARQSPHNLHDVHRWWSCPLHWPGKHLLMGFSHVVLRWSMDEEVSDRISISLDEWSIRWRNCIEPSFCIGQRSLLRQKRPSPKRLSKDFFRVQSRRWWEPKVRPSLTIHNSAGIQIGESGPLEEFLNRNLNGEFIFKIALQLWMASRECVNGKTQEISLQMIWRLRHFFYWCRCSNESNRIELIFEREICFV